MMSAAAPRHRFNRRMPARRPPRFLPTVTSGPAGITPLLTSPAIDAASSSGVSVVSSPVGFGTSLTTFNFGFASVAFAAFEFLGSGAFSAGLSTDFFASASATGLVSAALALTGSAFDTGSGGLASGWAGLDFTADSTGFALGAGAEAFSGSDFGLAEAEAGTFSADFAAATAGFGLGTAGTAGFAATLARGVLADLSSAAFAKEETWGAAGVGLGAGVAAGFDAGLAAGALADATAAGLDPPAAATAAGRVTPVGFPTGRTGGEVGLAGVAGVCDTALGTAAASTGFGTDAGVAPATPSFAVDTAAPGVAGLAAAPTGTRALGGTTRAAPGRLTFGGNRPEDSAAVDPTADTAVLADPAAVALMESGPLSTSRGGNADPPPGTPGVPAAWRPPFRITCSSFSSGVMFSFSAITHPRNPLFSTPK